MKQDKLYERILDLALASLARANMDAAFMDRGKEHRQLIAPLSAAHAGELIFKAILAKHDPIAIFRQPQSVTSTDINWLLENAKTINFGELPQKLETIASVDLPDQSSFKKLQKVRNQIQHFTYPNVNLTEICLDFIYKNLDPLLKTHFDLYAFQIHEDWFDDDIVGCLFRNEYYFSCPDRLDLTEIDPLEELSGGSTEYRKWALSKLGLSA